MNLGLRMVLILHLNRNLNVDLLYTVDTLIDS